MRNRTSLGFAAFAFSAIVATAVVPAWALSPTPAAVSTLDADERAQGNRLDIARRIGDVAFRTRWPAQVLKIGADSIGNHLVVELRISGVKFHTPLTRAGLLAEITTLVGQSFAIAPAEEVDVTVEIPYDERRGIVVSGDLAKPTSQTVFTISVRRGESAAALQARLRSGQGVYWDEDWAKSALKVGG